MKRLFRTSIRRLYDTRVETINFKYDPHKIIQISDFLCKHVPFLSFMPGQVLCSQLQHKHTQQPSSSWKLLWWFSAFCRLPFFLRFFFFLFSCHIFDSCDFCAAFACSAAHPIVFCFPFKSTEPFDAAMPCHVLCVCVCAAHSTAMAVLSLLQPLRAHSAAAVVPKTAYSTQIRMGLLNVWPHTHLHMHRARKKKKSPCRLLYHSFRFFFLFFLFLARSLHSNVFPVKKISMVILFFEIVRLFKCMSADHRQSCSKWARGIRESKRASNDGNDGKDAENQKYRGPSVRKYQPKI